MLEMLRGKIDVALDTLGLSKERWLEKNYPDRFNLLEKRSTRVSYLAMNTAQPDSRAQGSPPRDRARDRSRHDRPLQDVRPGEPRRKPARA